MSQRQLPGIRRLRRRVVHPPQSPKKLQHVSFEVHRCRTGLVERIFAEAWMKWNKRHDHDILNMLMPPGFNVTQREASVVATVIQWLGTNVGSGFLHHCLGLAGERIVQDSNHPKNDYYSGHEDGIYSNLCPSAWYMFMKRHTFHRPSQEFEPIEDMRVSRRHLELAQGHIAAAVEKRRAARLRVRQDRIITRLGGQPDWRFHSATEPTDEDLASMKLAAIYRNHIRKR